MSTSEDIPGFMDTQGFVYKVFNKALYDCTLQIEKTNNINHLEQNPEELYETIISKRQKTNMILRILVERHDTLKMTKSYELKKYCLATVPILSNHFAVTVNQINRLNKIYRKYLGTWQNASDVCAKLDRIVQMQEERKQSVRRKCKKLISMYDSYEEN